MNLNAGYKNPVWFVFGIGLAGLLVACAAPAGTGEIKSEKERQPVVAGKDKIAELVAGNSEKPLWMWMRPASRPLRRSSWLKARSRW